MCRVQTPEAPRFGAVEGKTVALIDGTPFDRPACPGLSAVAPAGRSVASYTTTRDTIKIGTGARRSPSTSAGT